MMAIRYIYAREWSGGICMGGFEPAAKPAFEGNNAVPRDFAFQLFADDYDQFDILFKVSEWVELELELSE